MQLIESPAVHLEAPGTQALYKIEHCSVIQKLKRHLCRKVTTTQQFDDIDALQLSIFILSLQIFFGTPSDGLPLLTWLSFKISSFGYPRWLFLTNRRKISPVIDIHPIFMKFFPDSL